MTYLKTMAADLKMLAASYRRRVELDGPDHPNTPYNLRQGERFYDAALAIEEAIAEGAGA